MKKQVQKLKESGFVYGMQFDRKSEANEYASQARKTGYNARVLTDKALGKEYYDVWVKKVELL